MKNVLTRAGGVTAAVLMLTLAGPSATAAIEPTPTPSEETTCRMVVTPERVLPNGKVRPEKTHYRGNCRDERKVDREGRKEEREAAKDARAELRDLVREAGGTWGAVMRQDALIKNLTRFAERLSEDPDASVSQSLARMITLINKGLPESLQFDVEPLLSAYGLTLDDLLAQIAEDDADEDDDEDGDDDESPEPSESSED